MKSHDLSVEEILSSIRGVINNHSMKFAKKPEVTEDVLELTEERTLSNHELHDNKKRDKEATSNASDALRNFATRASNIDSAASKTPSGKSIEELVMDILRPEISKWLSQNLPALVKQLVEKEIRRLAS